MFNGEERVKMGVFYEWRVGRVNVCSVIVYVCCVYRKIKIYIYIYMIFLIFTEGFREEDEKGIAWKNGEFHKDEM